MKLETTRIRDFLIVTVQNVPKGQLDMTNVKFLKKNIPSSLPENEKNIVMDFEKINYIDSSVIGFLVDLLNTYRNVGGTVGLLRINSKIRNILELANLAKFFSIYDTPDQLAGK